jgi:hypothetical protein
MGLGPGSEALSDVGDLLIRVVQPLLDEAGDIIGGSGAQAFIPELLHHEDDPHLGLGVGGHRQLQLHLHGPSLPLRQGLAAADIRWRPQLMVVRREYLVLLHLDRVIINNYNLIKKAIN